VNITDVNVAVLQVSVEHAYVAAGRGVEGNWHVLARVTTDDGIEGMGYIVSLIPNALRGEYVPRSAAIVRDMPALEDGCLVASKAPGLGLELVAAAMRRYRVN
jgi:L-alanine-DL-glutamate epimerase-like enolase superfamily enzyme